MYLLDHQLIHRIKATPLIIGGILMGSPLAPSTRIRLPLKGEAELKIPKEALYFGLDGMKGLFPGTGYFFAAN